MSDIFSSELLSHAATCNASCYETVREIRRTASPPFNAEVSILCESADLLTLGEELELAVSSCRLMRLREQSGSTRPDPYNHSDLATVDVDEHGLVKVTTFDQGIGGFAKDETVFEILPALHNRNSSRFCLKSLNRFNGEQEVRIRLDPFMSTPKADYREPLVKMFVYGKPLSWDAVLSLNQVSAHHWIPDSMLASEGVCRTDAVFTPRGREVHFQCEECPTEKAATHRPSRYFHTIIDLESGVVTHCDGAIRIYSPEEAASRAKVHLRDTGKIGTRIKVFQVDGPVESEHWSELFQSFFVWNDDIEKFASDLACA